MLRTFSTFFCGRTQSEEKIQTLQGFSKEKFLANFIKHSSILSAEIYSYKIRTHSLKDYVVYKIHVKTCEIEYKLEKRFRDFWNFKEKLDTVNPEFKLEETFPAKKIFGNLSLDTLLFRKQRLSSFLQDVLKLQKDPQSTSLILLDFFEIHLAYMRNNVDIMLFSFKEEIFNLSITEDDRKLLDLLFVLNKDTDNMISNFSKFHEFFEKSPNLSLGVLHILFKGYGTIKGLINLCGDLNSENSHLHLSCCSCLKLLCFLMDYEENSNAEVFLEIFAGLTSREFASLGLASHIIESPSKICKKSALKLLDIYKGSNPNTNSFLFGQILDNEEAYDTFRKWKSSMTIVSQKTESFSIDYIEDSNNLTEDTKLESRNLLRLNSSLFYENSKPKSGLFKRKTHKSSPLIVKPIIKG